MYKKFTLLLLLTHASFMLSMNSRHVTNVSLIEQTHDQTTYDGTLSDATWVIAKKTITPDRRSTIYVTLEHQPSGSTIFAIRDPQRALFWYNTLEAFYNANFNNH